MVKELVKSLFVFRWAINNEILNSSPPIYIVADTLVEAQTIVIADDNTLAIPNNNWNGCKCIQEIKLDKSQNLNLVLK